MTVKKNILPVSLSRRESTRRRRKLYLLLFSVALGAISVAKFLAFTFFRLCASMPLSLRASHLRFLLLTFFAFVPRCLFVPRIYPFAPRIAKRLPISFLCDMICRKNKASQKQVGQVGQWDSGVSYPQSTAFYRDTRLL